MNDFNDDIITIQQFDDIKDCRNYYYELIDGEICISSRPTMIEKNILLNISSEIQRYLKGKEYKVLLDTELQLKDDVYICNMCIVKNDFDLNSRRLQATPILVVELLLQDKSYFEIEDKMIKLKKAGVDEYWLANPKNKSISVFNLNNDVKINYFYNGSIKSSVLVDLDMPLSDIFN